MRFLSICSMIATLATPVMAQELPQGCFSRDYSAAHLSRNPEQVVDKITILFEAKDGYTSAEVKVLLADQGHAKRNGLGGMRASETGGNFQGDLRFGVECDGGWFDVLENSDGTLLIETQYFRLSQDGCMDGGARSTLSESAHEATRYRLNRDAPAACAW